MESRGDARQNLKIRLCVAAFCRGIFSALGSNCESHSQQEFDRRLINAMQTGQKVLRHSTPIKDQKNQQIIFKPSDPPWPPIAVFRLNDLVPPCMVQPSTIF